VDEGALAPAHGGVSVRFGNRRAAFEEELPIRVKLIDKSYYGHRMNYVIIG
jgi:hypothetical protein